MTSEFVLLGALEETRDTLSHLVRLGLKPSHIVGLPPQEAIRQRATNYVDLRPIASAENIPFSEVLTYSMKDETDVQLFRELNPRLLFVVGWQRLLPTTVLEHVKMGTVGFHGSCNILPWGRGRSPINWSIIEGRNRFALHMFFIKPGVDDGEIIGIKIYDITPWDDCRTVYYKTAIAQAELIATYLPLLHTGESPRMRQYGEEFYYPKRTPEDGRIDWSADADTICRLVRAVTWPYPGACTLLAGIQVRIWEAQPFSRDFFEKALPGEVCFVAGSGTGEFVVRCGGGTVLVRKAETTAIIEVGDRFS